jgi:hypothetical protein
VTLGASFHCCSFSATRRQLVTRGNGEFKAEDGIWFRRRQKWFQLCFVRNSSRVPPNENPARLCLDARAGSREPSVECRKLLSMRAPLGKRMGAAEVPGGHLLAPFVSAPIFLGRTCIGVFTLTQSGERPERRAAFGSALRCVGCERVIRIAGIHKIGPGGAQQPFDLLDCSPNYAARLASPNLAL